MSDYLELSPARQAFRRWHLFMRLVVKYRRLGSTLVESIRAAHNLVRMHVDFAHEFGPDGRRRAQA